MPNLKTVSWFIREMLARNRLRMTNTTGFFRNTEQLKVLCSILPNPKTAYVFGCSDGCEAYSLAMFYKTERPDCTLRISCFDVDIECLEAAKKAVYDSSKVDYYEDGNVLDGPWGKYFHKVQPGLYQIDRAIVESCSFTIGNVLDTDFMRSLEPADIVFCQNLLVHLKPAENGKAMELLCGLLASGTLLVIGGMRPNLRYKFTKSLGLKPVTNRCKEIHEGQKDLRYFWDTRRSLHRPYYALPPFSKCKDWQFKYSTIFCR